VGGAGRLRRWFGRCRSRLLPAIVTAGEKLRVEPHVDLRPEAIVVRVPFRGPGRIPAGAADFAAEEMAAVRLTPRRAVLQPHTLRSAGVAADPADRERLRKHDKP
jgi:hypothetical protein